MSREQQVRAIGRSLPGAGPAGHGRAARAARGRAARRSFNGDGQTGRVAFERAAIDVARAVARGGGHARHDLITRVVSAVRRLDEATSLREHSRRARRRRVGRGRRARPCSLVDTDAVRATGTRLRCPRVPVDVPVDASPLIANVITFRQAATVPAARARDDRRHAGVPARAARTRRPGDSAGRRERGRGRWCTRRARSGAEANLASPCGPNRSRCWSVTGRPGSRTSRRCGPSRSCRSVLTCAHAGVAPPRSCSTPAPSPPWRWSVVMASPRVHGAAPQAPSFAESQLWLAPADEIVGRRSGARRGAAGGGPRGRGSDRFTRAAQRPPARDLRAVSSRPRLPRARAVRRGRSGRRGRWSSTVPGGALGERRCRCWPRCARGREPLARCGRRLADAGRPERRAAPACTA